MVKKLLENRSQTLAAIMEVQWLLSQKVPKWDELTPDKHFQLAMQFYQCERGRLQKVKMVWDILNHAGPWAVALYALWKAH